MLAPHICNTTPVVTGTVTQWHRGARVHCWRQRVSARRAHFRRGREGRHFMSRLGNLHADDLEITASQPPADVFDLKGSADFAKQEKCYLLKPLSSLPRTATMATAGGTIDSQTRSKSPAARPPLNFPGIEMLSGSPPRPLTIPALASTPPERAHSSLSAASKTDSSTASSASTTSRDVPAKGEQPRKAAFETPTAAASFIARQFLGLEIDSSLAGGFVAVARLGRRLLKLTTLASDSGVGGHLLTRAIAEAYNSIHNTMQSDGLEALAIVASRGGIDLEAAGLHLASQDLGEDDSQDEQTVEAQQHVAQTAAYRQAAKHLAARLGRSHPGTLMSIVESNRKFYQQHRGDLLRCLNAAASSDPASTADRSQQGPQGNVVAKLTSRFGEPTSDVWNCMATLFVIEASDVGTLDDAKMVSLCQDVQGFFGALHSGMGSDCISVEPPSLSPTKSNEEEHGRRGPQVATIPKGLEAPQIPAKVPRREARLASLCARGYEDALKSRFALMPWARQADVLRSQREAVRASEAVYAMRPTDAVALKVLNHRLRTSVFEDSFAGASKRSLTRSQMQRMDVDRELGTSSSRRRRVSLPAALPGHSSTPATPAVAAPGRYQKRRPWQEASLDRAEQAVLDLLAAKHGCHHKMLRCKTCAKHAPAQLQHTLPWDELWAAAAWFVDHDRFPEIVQSCMARLPQLKSCD